MSKSKDLWRVLRCSYHRRSAVIADLVAEGFVIHDTFLNTAGVRDNEEFNIVARRLEAA